MESIETKAAIASSVKMEEVSRSLMHHGAARTASSSPPSQEDTTTTTTTTYCHSCGVLPENDVYEENCINLSLLDPTRYGWMARGGIANVTTPHEVRSFHDDAIRRRKVFIVFSRSEIIVFSSIVLLRACV